MPRQQLEEILHCIVLNNSLLTKSFTRTAFSQGRFKMPECKPNRRLTALLLTFRHNRELVESASIVTSSSLDLAASGEMR